MKAPKIYFRDTGLLHALTGVQTLAGLLTHPQCGASWEGFALEQVLRIAEPHQAYFWATHQGAELDLLMLRGGQRIGVEFKRADTPRVSASMRIAMADLKLDALYVVYPGRQLKMQVLVRPELPTAAVRSSQATLGAQKVIRRRKPGKLGVLIAEMPHRLCHHALGVGQGKFGASVERCSVL